MPIPPAADTAATSSGLLHGYMAPQMRGTSIPTWVAKELPRGPAEPTSRLT